MAARATTGPGLAITSRIPGLPPLDDSWMDHRLAFLAGAHRTRRGITRGRYASRCLKVETPDRRRQGNAAQKPGQKVSRGALPLGVQAGRREIVEFLANFRGAGFAVWDDVSRWRFHDSPEIALWRRRPGGHGRGSGGQRR